MIIFDLMMIIDYGENDRENNDDHWWSVITMIVDSNNWLLWGFCDELKEFNKFWEESYPIFPIDIVPIVSVSKQHNYLKKFKCFK